MRAGFLAGILLLAAGYTWIAFAELALLSSAGRLGPGFFPRIIGATLVVLCAWSLVEEPGRRAREPRSKYWRDAVALALLSGLFGAGLVGFFMKLHGYSPAALVLALVLGPLAEQSLRQTMTISGGSFGIFVDRPMSLAILGITVAMLAAGVLVRRGRRPD